MCIKEENWPLNLVHVVRPYINAAVCGELIQNKNTVLFFEFIDSGNGSLDLCCLIKLITKDCRTKSDLAD